MKIAFRTDASLQMGSGHVMRCLTLADALKAQGAQCHFISRAHPGNLLETISRRGFKVSRLAYSAQKAQVAGNLKAKKTGASQQEPAHMTWLGSDWQADAHETSFILAELHADWLVVDHYALDHRWEEVLAPYCRKLLIIDDLADRHHLGDLLVDQNLGHQPQDYTDLVPASCQVLAGPCYALLRPEFAALRNASLKRRTTPQSRGIKQLLITMGGVDLPNATGRVLDALKTCPLPVDCRITIVMGAAAPALAHVRELAGKMPWPSTVLVNVANMAQHMTESDLAIGAAGSTSWERCCLGLPTLIVVLAANQRDIAVGLECAGAAIVLDLHKDEKFAKKLRDTVGCLVKNETALISLSRASSRVTSGYGANMVVDEMLKIYTL